MKKIVFLFFIFCTLHASEPQYIKTNLGISNGKALVLLSDDTIWELYPVSVRTRSWSEWWNSVEIDKPEPEFLCDFNKWPSATDVTILEHNWSDLPESALQKYNNPEVKRCLYILVNIKTGEKAFATPLKVDELFVIFPQLCKTSYDQGYQSGHSIGYSKGYTLGYDLGYREGYRKGHDDGSRSHVAYRRSTLSQTTPTTKEEATQSTQLSDKK